MSRKKQEEAAAEILEHKKRITSTATSVERALFTIMSYVNYMASELNPPPVIKMHKLGTTKAVLVVDFAGDRKQFLVTVAEMEEGSS
jgi:hypothetical protein